MDEDNEMTDSLLPIAKPVERTKEEIWNEDQREDVSDLTSLSEEDKAWQFGTAGLDELDDDEDMEDLFEVTEEDIVGESSQPEQPKVRFSAVNRSYRLPIRPPNTFRTMR